MRHFRSASGVRFFFERLQIEQWPFLSLLSALISRKITELAILKFFKCHKVFTIEGFTSKMDCHET